MYLVKTFHATKLRSDVHSMSKDLSKPFEPLKIDFLLEKLLKTEVPKIACHMDRQSDVD